MNPANQNSTPREAACGLAPVGPDETHTPTVLLAGKLTALDSPGGGEVQMLALYRALGIYLPLITTNCAVLGVAVLNIEKSYGFIETVVHGFSAGIGFTIALVLMAGIRERIELADVPEPLKGVPVAFIVAGLMSIAFLGFSGLAAE